MNKALDSERSTSTADKIILPDSDEDLLAECDVDTFRAGGKGGQHVNTTESAVRLTHRSSGVVTTSQAERSQHRNKATCLKNLRAKIERLNYRPPKRVPTKVSRGVKAKSLEAKVRHSQKKRLRSGKPHRDEE